MPRFLTDDSFDSDPAVLRAGTAAMGLYYRCGIYVARQLLDGIVPAEIAAQYGTPEWAKRLTDAVLWEPVQGGYRMPLYFAHGNPTREKVLADRQAKSERQQRWLEKNRNTSSKPRRTNRPSRDASQDTSITQSVDTPLPPSLTGRKGDAPPPPSAGTASARPSNQSVAEAMRRGIEPGHRAAAPERQAAAAAAARQALAAKLRPP
jgi:hypothetical protein